MSEIFKALNKAGALLTERADDSGLEPLEPLPEGAKPAVPELEEQTETVSVKKVKDRALRLLLQSDTVFAEQLRVLRTKVHALSNASPFEVFGIVSAAEREGKTSLAIGLASALAAKKDCRVLVVEANLRRPCIEKRLRLTPSAGLLEWLAGGADRLLVRRIEPFGFFLLSAGDVHHVVEQIGKTSDLLNGKRMEELLSYLRTLYDYVIVDCTSLTPIADAVTLQDYVDGLLLVVRSRFTSQETIQRAMTHLKRGTVRGVVFNAHRRILR